MGSKQWRSGALAWLAVVVMLGVTPVGADDIAVRAEVDRTQLTIEDQIMLDVVIEGSFRGARPEAPPLPDFDVYPRGTSQSMQMVNGTVTSSITYTYILVPKREGALTIPSFVVNAGGKQHQTEPIAITVGAAGGSGGGGSGGGRGGGASGRGVAPGAPSVRPDEREDRDLFVVGKVDKQAAHVNEQIIYTFYLYRAERAAQVTNVSYQAPSFQGFWVEKLKDSEKSYFQMVNGRRFNVTELSTAIFPTTSGTLSIDPATLQLVVLTTPFGFSLFDRGTERILKTKAVTVEVEALPAAGKPAIFDGAAGEGLTLSATLDRAEVEEGEPITLTSRVEGAGNVKTFSKPRFPDLPQFKTYEADSKTDIQTTDRVSGRRVYETVLVPKDEGEHVIPPLQLAYFDTKEGRYKTLETKPLQVTVVKSTNPDRVADAGIPTQQDIRILGKDIAHIRTDVPVSDMLTPLYRRGLFGAMLPLPLLAVVGAAFLQRRRERFATDVALARATRARKMAKKHLSAASESMRRGDGAAFYAEVARALRQFVGDKLNVSATGMTHAELFEKLGESGASTELAARLVGMLERCDAARFAPGSMGGEALREALSEAESLLVTLDGTLRRRGGSRSGGMVALAPWLAPLTALALLAAAAGPVRAQDKSVPMVRAGDYVPPQELLRRGHEAYESGNFQAAVDAYTRAERAGVRNGPLYYNLGNAYFKSGALGRAIACYRRAERLAPRDPQVHANLEYALARREDKALETRDVPFVSWVQDGFRRLSLNEWLLVAAGLYTVACGVWIARRMVRANPVVLRWAFLACCALTSLATLAVVFKVRAEHGVPHGVVTVSKVDVTSGPGRTYTAEFALHEGAEVRIEETRADWLRISLGEKLRGWVPASSLVRI